MSGKVTKTKVKRIGRGGMQAAFSRLLAILALVLMPIGMSGTPASASTSASALASASASDRGQVATMACGSHKEPSEPAPDREAHCASCIAVADPGAAFAEDPLESSADLADRGGRLLLGIRPDVATPPPRAS